VSCDNLHFVLINLALPILLLDIGSPLIGIVITTDVAVVALIALVAVLTCGQIFALLLLVLCLGPNLCCMLLLVGLYVCFLHSDFVV
jgi:hypothetical protein